MAVGYAKNGYTVEAHDLLKKYHGLLKAYRKFNIHDVVQLHFHDGLIAHAEWVVAELEQRGVKQ